MHYPKNHKKREKSKKLYLLSPNNLPLKVIEFALLKRDYEKNV